MPSHIDIRCGRRHEAITANLNAVEADRRYRAIAGPPTGFLPLYVAHNEHMLAYAAMVTSQSDLAIKHMPRLSALLLEASREGRSWHELVDDAYWNKNLEWHLAAAKQWNDLAA